MRIKSNTTWLLIALILSLTVAGCGGGGGNNTQKIRVRS
jgi:hypothetical protein